MSKKKNKKLKYAPKATKSKLHPSHKYREDWEREDRLQKAINQGEIPPYEYD